MNKVAIINRTNFKNYGSVLQCYALCCAVEKLGFESEIVWEEGNISKNFDFRPNKIISSVWKLVTHPSLISSTMTNVSDLSSRVISEKTVALFDEFVSSEVKQKKFPHRELVRRARSDEYAKFICGSDQIWCSTTLYVDPLMYLRFSPREKRIAYAPSIGRDFIPDYNKRRMKKYISDIPHLSVRETEGARLINELTGMTAKVVLDPTLLHTRTDWNTIKADMIVNDKYILCYFLDSPSEKTQEKIAELAKSRGVGIIALVSKLDVCEKMGVEVSYPDCGPREFLAYVEKTELTVTDSYHGMLFSIIYGKDFWSVERAYRQYDQSSRQKTVLSMLSLENRYLSAEGDFEFSDDKIDYTAVETTLANRREESLSFLQRALSDN